MVSGLFVPVIGAFLWKRSSSIAAMWAMIIGGGTTITLIASGIQLPLKLDANIFGITASAVTFLVLTYLYPNKEPVKDLEEYEIVNTN